MPHPSDTNCMVAAQSFQNLTKFVDAAKAMTDGWSGILERSGNVLGLGMDPFLLPISEHRALGHFDENTYSDWLAWVLTVAFSSGRYSSRLCDQLFVDPSDLTLSGPVEVPNIERESPAERGHEGRAGRHDILIVFPTSQRVWHIEAKVTTAERADVQKHPGYVESLGKQYPACDIRHLFLVTSADRRSYPISSDTDAPAFQAITWEELAGRMRRIVSKSGSHDLPEAMILFLCALIEQKLLGMHSGSLRQMNFVSRNLEIINARV
jgi:hypothetical protein